MTTTLKTCFKCRKTLDVSEFYKHRAMRDGLLGKCKECTKEDVSKHRIINIEKIREYDKLRASMPHRMALRASVVSEYKKTFPNRTKATCAVNNAIRDRKLVKHPCFICGAIRVVGHHPDYGNPLDVVWLCQAHHKQTHAMAESIHKEK